MEKSIVEVLPAVDLLAEKCNNFKLCRQNGTLLLENNEINVLWPQVILMSGHEMETVNLLTSLRVDPAEAEGWVKEALNRFKYPPTCSQLGCDDGQIAQCFPRCDPKKVKTVSPVRHILHPVKKASFIISKELPAVLNKSKHPSPHFLHSIKLLEDKSPAEYQECALKLKQAGLNFLESMPNQQSVSLVTLEDKGFLLKDGQVIGINETRYAKYILNNFEIVVTSGTRFYMYEDGVWRFKDFEEKLSRILMDFLHRDVANFWSSGIERKYYNGLKRIAPFVDFDADKNFINLENGIYSIDQDTLLPHSKEYYLTIRVPIKYSPEAECLKFMKFLNEIFEGDTELIDLIGCVMGYCLTSETKAHKGFMFYGSGSNGKTVLAEVMAVLAGKENVSALSLGDLDKSFARAEIVGKTVNVSTENEVDENKFNTQFLKMIIGGDSIRVEEKHKMGYSYKPICKLLLCMNNLPYSRDSSHGFFRRLIIIPFNKRISEREANKNLINELLEELPGIFNFAIKGLKRLRNNNYIFTKAKASENALNEYRAEIDPMFEFINQRITESESKLKLRRKDIRSAYNDFLFHEGYKKPKDVSDKRYWKSFREELRRRKINFTEEKVNGERAFGGIKLIDSEPEQQGGEGLIKSGTNLSDFFKDDD